MPHRQTQLSEVDAFHLLADRAKVMIWTSGPDKLCNWFNRAWLEFTGRAMEQELGNGWAEGVHPDELSTCLSVYTTAFDSRQEFGMEYQLRRHDGVYRLVLDVGSPYFSVNGEFLGYFGSCIDMTAGMRDTPTQTKIPRVTRQTRVGERAFKSVAENEACKDPSGAEIRAALERIVASESFRTCPQLAAFLRFITEATLCGESTHLKGYTIAVEAMGRCGDFDPQQDPIVRVEAGRLRRMIQHYYSGPGAQDPLIIDVPRGRYVPTFRYRGAPLDAETLITCVDEAKTAGARRPDGDTSLDDTPTPFRGYDFLTPREREVLTQITAGASSKEAGRQLGISFRTIEIHRARIMEKLGAKNAADLVRIVSTRAV